MQDRQAALVKVMRSLLTGLVEIRAELMMAIHRVAKQVHHVLQVICLGLILKAQHDGVMEIWWQFRDSARALNQALANRSQRCERLANVALTARCA